MQLALASTIAPLFFAILFLFSSSSFDSGVPDVDHDFVDNHGRPATAIITNIETRDNIEINGKNPAIITYEYNAGGKLIKNQYRTLASDRVNAMNTGDSIEIKYTDEGSIIVDVEPIESFMGILLSVLAPLLIIGLTILGFLYLRVRQGLSLYRYGDVKHAEIVSVQVKNGLPLSSFGKRITVHYQYQTTQGQHMLGSSVTLDHTMLNSKLGDVVKIFVSTDDESKSCLVNKIDQIRNNWQID